MSRTATLQLRGGELRVRLLRLHWPLPRVAHEVVDGSGAVLHRGSHRTRRGTTPGAALADLALDLLDDRQRAVFVRHRPEVDLWVQEHRDELASFVVERLTSTDLAGWGQASPSS